MNVYNMSKLNKIFSKNIGFNIINYIYFNTKNYVERRNENEQKLKDINWINKFINSDSITFNLDSTTKIELYKDSILSRLIFEGFEVDEIAFLKKTLKPGDIFLDVGANIGVFSLIAANIVTESGKVICFEPSPVTYNRLVSNIKINNFTNIDAFNVGLSDKSDTLDLNISENGYDAWNTFAKVENEKFHKKIAIKVNTLDKALENIAKEKIRLVKLDVEGWEKFVLLGGKNFLDRRAHV